MTSLHYCRVSPERLLTVNGANTGIKLGNFQSVAVLDMICLIQKYCGDVLYNFVDIVNYH